MDQIRFDALARSLAAPTTRRRAVGLALAGFLGIATSAREDAALVCRAAGKRCHPRQTCCLGTACVDGWCRPQEACGAAVCAAGSYCCNASCGICAPLGEGCTQDLC